MVPKKRWIKAVWIPYIWILLDFRSIKGCLMYLMFILRWRQAYFYLIDLVYFWSVLVLMIENILSFSVSACFWGLNLAGVGLSIAFNDGFGCWVPNVKPFSRLVYSHLLNYHVFYKLLSFLHEKSVTLAEIAV